MTEGIADAFLVLFVLVGGAIVMGHETVQTRTATGLAGQEKILLRTLQWHRCKTKNKRSTGNPPPRTRISRLSNPFILTRPATTQPTLGCRLHTSFLDYNHRESRTDVS